METEVVKHYVYVYVDSRRSGLWTSPYGDFTHQPLYVGKGFGTRCEHGLEALRKNNSKTTNPRLYNKLRKIVAEGLSVEIIKVVEDISNETSISIEAELIAHFGRMGFDDEGILCNILPDDGFDTTGIAPPNKGQTIEEFHGREKAEQIRTRLRAPKPRESIERGIATRKANGSLSPERHPMSKNWIAVSPTGEEFKIHGAVKSFCEDRGLSWQAIYATRNGGIVSAGRIRNKTRLTERFWKSLGWSLRQL